MSVIAIIMLLLAAAFIGWRLGWFIGECLFPMDEIETTIEESRL